MRDYLPMNARRRATVLDIVNEKSAGSPATRRPGWPACAPTAAT
jgi:hypothetical protein